MENKIVALVSMFDFSQTVMLPDGSTVKVPTSMVSNELIRYCDSCNVFTVHLFGVEEYVNGIIAEIEEKESIQYGKNKITFEVN